MIAAVLIIGALLALSVLAVAAILIGGDMSRRAYRDDIERGGRR